MGSSKNIFIFNFTITIIISFFFILSFVTAQILENCDYNYGNYTNGSTYQTNLNNLLSSLHSKIDPYGFANSSTSGDHDPAFAIFLCRGDFALESCRNCANESVSRLTKSCPGYKQASGTYDGCMLRYSNRSLTGSVSANVLLYMSISVNATNISMFNHDLASMMSDLSTKAAKGGSRLKFAVGNRTTLNSQTIFGLVQCTPDLSERQCKNCLIDMISRIYHCCAGNTLGGVFTWSCYLRFQMSLFYNETRVFELLSPPPVSPPPLLSPGQPSPVIPAGNNNGNTDQTPKIVAISISSMVGLILITFLCFIVSTRSKKLKKKEPVKNLDSPRMNYMNSDESMLYEFKTIQVATDDFSEANKLGHGGFGVVYKGTLSNGQEIAVKRLVQKSKQGNTEFKNEIALMSRLQHRNLMKLLGYCIDGKERLVIYEFVPNKSLDRFLFDPARQMVLNWETRYKIITGIARGLLYLHEGSRVTIIHHDLKASNVLLDVKMNPLISDFGMARLFSAGKSREITNRIGGTYGYMAPEYAYYGQYSVKTDVFSFGVLILEIITGKKNSFSNDESESSCGHLLSYVWNEWRKGQIWSIVDPTIMDDGYGEEKMRCITIGLLCVQAVADERPTMSLVMSMFDSVEVSMPLPSKPGFLMDVSASGMPLPMPDDAKSYTINHLSITDPCPR